MTPASSIRGGVVARGSSEAPSALSVAGLVATGVLSGVAVPFMRVASRHGLAAPSWTLLTSIVAATLLVSAALVRGARFGSGWRGGAFYAAAGLFSIALPNGLLFAATRALGAATASLAYTLPPVMTVGLAFATGIERASPRRLVGVVIGLAGTLAVVLPGRSVSADVPWSAVLLLVLVPLSIAIGNLVRARFWPEGTDALANAAGTTFSGAVWMSCAVLLGIGASASGTSEALRVLVLTVPHGVASALAMVCFFWLQRRAGAVFTSQVGYVATVTGLGIAAVAFDESLTPWAWGAAVLIVAGAAIGR